MADIVRLNATIPQQLDEFISFQVRCGKFSTKSDYLRHILRKEMDADRESQIEYVNRVLKESQESGLSDETPDEIRAGLKKVVKRAVASRKD